MDKVSVWVRNGLALVGVLALGYWLGAGRAVSASSSGQSSADVGFELTGVNETSSLLVYQPTTKTVYVYREPRLAIQLCNAVTNSRWTSPAESFSGFPARRPRYCRSV